MHARDYQPGEQVPGTVYRVVRLIGAGGMGTVYDVEDTTIGKRYVLKTLHPQLGAREDLARRMQNEARTLARLNHPNIVEVFTAGVTADDLRLPYYVMERLNGQSLRVVLEKKGQLERQHAFHIGIDLLDALDHAHDKGSHSPRRQARQHFPSSFVVRGHAYEASSISGSSRYSTVAPRETAGRFPPAPCATPPPEQLRGERPTPKGPTSTPRGSFSTRSSRGADRSTTRATRTGIGAAHLNKPPPSLSRFVALPRELEALIMASLAKDPAFRPRDAFSFGASLRNLETHSTRLGAPARRSR